MKRSLYLRMAILSIILAVALSSASLVAVAEEETFDTGFWDVQAYVDEFDLPTDDYYVVSSPISGTFSNTAVTREPLTAYLYYGNIEYTYAIWFKLLTYGNTVEKNIYDTRKYYDITVMDNEGEKTSFSGFMGPKSDLLYIDPDAYTDNRADTSRLCSILTTGGTVRIAINEADNPLVKYVLTIDDASGFRNARSKYVEKQLITCGLYLGAKVKHNEYGEGVVSSLDDLKGQSWLYPYIYADFSDGRHGFFENDVKEGVLTIIE